jgi:hypothetical protein
MASIGDLVHASESEVFDPLIRWAVGVFQRRVIVGDITLYAVGKTKDGHTWGLYRFMRKLEDEKQARQIIRACREAREEQYINHDPRPIGDQIREFLRQEAMLDRLERNVSET